MYFNRKRRINELPYFRIEKIETWDKLNRGGDRAANSALHIIAIGRLRIDARTKEYVEKRLTQGHTKLEALR